MMALHGDLVPVCVLGREERRLRIHLPDGSEQLVAAARLFWGGETVLASADALAATWAEVTALAERADLEAAWQGLSDDDAVPSAAQVAAGALGDSSALARDAVALAVFGDNLFFRIRRHTLMRETAAAVTATLARREAERIAERRLALAEDVFKRRLSGGMAAAGDTEAAAAASFYLDALADLAARGLESEHADDAWALMDALGRDREGAFGLLEDLGEFTHDENLALRRAGLRRGFSAAVLEDARRAAERPVGARRDFMSLLTVAIDDASTTEVDDAFAVDGDRLFVFIADVAARVRPGTPGDAEAARRASTLYLPEGKIPMLPPILGSGAASLLEGQPRTALYFSFEVTSDGRLIGLEVGRARIVVDKQMTYEEADGQLTGERPDGPFAPMLRSAAGWMDFHRDRRERAGALFLQRNEVYLDAASGDRIGVLRGDPYAPGRLLVAEMMIATCAAAAEFCVDNQIPCIYRSQKRPDGPATWHMGRVDGPAAQWEILRKLKPAVQSTRPARHFTLAVEVYCQLTSPLRRYADLLMHQQLSYWVKTGHERFTKGQLSARFNDLERLTSLVKRVENESRRYWALRWIEQNRDKPLAARPVREVGRRWIVELTDLAIQTPVNLSPRPRRDEALSLRVELVNARADELVLTR